MKLLLGVLCLAFLTEFYNCGAVISVEETGKPIDLAYVCVHITSHEETEEKSPILLVHGLLGFKEMWFPLMQLLSVRTDRKVCAADLRNHGDSPWSDEFHTDVMAKDIERLVEKLKTNKVIILGHSLGGKTAVQFTLTNPEKVEKLIVEDMRPNSVVDDPDLKNFVKIDVDETEKILKAIPEGATELEARRFVYQIFEEAFKQRNDTLGFDDTIINHFPIKCSNGKCSWKANMKVLAKVTEEGSAALRPSSGKFSGPTLFIYGEKSPFRVGDVKDEILALFPNAELYGVEGASHNVNVFPDYKRKVLEFILE